jgi:hypothetical protein
VRREGFFFAEVSGNFLTQRLKLTVAKFTP